MDQGPLDAVFAQPVAQRLLAARMLTRLAYTGTDGAPRVVPVASWWSGSTMVVCTAPNSAKVPAFQRDPRAAVTIDTEGLPPNVLLVRICELETVDGVPDEFLAASRKQVSDEQWDEWEAGTRGLYDAMVRITITPTWAKILDFETTIPSAVEELVRQKRSAGA